MPLSRCSRLQRRTKGDWEIDYSELEMGEQLGTGGYGEVNKAMRKGTEVAVKMMVSASVTKDMERDFRDEVCVTVSPPSPPLRHAPVGGLENSQLHVCR